MSRLYKPNTKVIVVKLMGGLGNQMFQYACAKNISIKTHGKLLFDTFFLNHRSPDCKYTERDFELDVFNLKVESCNYKMVSCFYKPNNTIYNLYKRFSSLKHVYEKNRTFNTTLLQVKSSIYLEGYWQSELYFSEIRDIIKEDFTFPTRYESNYISSLTKEINESNSVGVHIRQGDYLNNSVNKSIFVNLSKSYYSDAISLCLKKIKNPTFYIFSDDIAKASECLPTIREMKLVRHLNPMPNYVDMKLMSLCKHNIIANSSYSWWAAWLNPNINKIVIAPKKWYALFDDQDVINSRIPISWMKI